MFELAIGVAAAIAFPIIVLTVHRQRESLRNRRAGRRRNDKISL